MSVKYHFNTKTGNPNICRAEKNCPFGGDEVHYPSKEEARKGYEARQQGSFPEQGKKPAKKAPAKGLMNAEADYSKAKRNSVVEFADGTRFIKTDQDTWETSSQGGYALGDEEMAGYPARKGISPGARLVPMEKEPKAEKPAQKPTEEPKRQEAPAAAPVKPKATLKATTLKNASYEEGMQARRYFLLINHRDPEQIAAANGKVQDQALVNDLQEFNELKEREEELKNAYRKAAEAARNSKSQAQHDGYRRVMEMKANQLAEITGKLEEVDGRITEHGKRYAKQLVIHRRSLDSIERLAKQGVKSSPPGVKDRIYKLARHQKETRSVKELHSKVSSNRPEDVLAAAREFGNPIYIKRAERYAEAAKQLNELNSEAAALQRAFNSVSSPQVKETVQRELAALQERQGAVTAEYEKAAQGIKLFSDDIAARYEQEQDIARELNVLRKFISRD